MLLSWRSLAEAPPGGAVYRLSGEPASGDWLAAPAGLFRLEPDGWQPQLTGIPFYHVTAVTVAYDTILVAGLPTGLVRSLDGGQSWQGARIEQTTAPITCLAASPRFAHDRILLAGTRGDGILRSTDGGRYWDLVNFGLRSFDLLELAVAPDWQGHEYAFAVTPQGIYQSPNGGRAWRLVLPGPDEAPLQCVAVSQRFGRDGLVWAGDESGRLFRSGDRGRHWEPLVYKPGSWPAVNALAANPDGSLLAGTPLGIWRSADQGATWSLAAGALQARPDAGATELGPPADARPVLQFSRWQRRPVAGLAAGGALISDDEGRRWTSLPGIAARRFLWLETLDDGLVLAAGPEAGLWIWTVDAGRWQRSIPGGGDDSLLALAADGQAAWLSSARGLWRRDALETDWRPIWQPEAPLLALAAVEDTLIAADQAGRLWRLAKGRREQLPSPAPNLQPLALAVSPRLTHDGCLALATASATQGDRIVWFSRDSGHTWHHWQTLLAGAGRLLLQLSGPDVGWLAHGARIWSWRAGTEPRIQGDEASEGPMSGWEETALSRREAPLTALTMLQKGLVLASNGDDIYFTQDGSPWSQLGHDDPWPRALVAMAPDPVAPAERVLALTSHGTLWRGYNPPP